MNSSDNFQDSALSRLMPLMNSSFTPGQAQATVDNFQDPDQRQIAQAELYYFSGRAEECRNIAELYLQDKDLCLRLSAALYILFPILLWQSICFQNGIQKYPGMSSSRKRQFCTKRNHGLLCFCQLSGHGTDASSTDGLPPLQDFLPSLPSGFALMLFISSLITLIFTKNINGRWDYASLSF